MRNALQVALVCSGVALLMGKGVASGVILAVGLMFLLEYRLGGKDWGIPTRGTASRTEQVYS